MSAERGAPEGVTPRARQLRSLRAAVRLKGESYQQAALEQYERAADAKKNTPQAMSAAALYGDWVCCEYLVLLREQLSGQRPNDRFSAYETYLMGYSARLRPEIAQAAKLVRDAFKEGRIDELIAGALMVLGFGLSSFAGPEFTWVSRTLYAAAGVLALCLLGGFGPLTQLQRRCSRRSALQLIGEIEIQCAGQRNPFEAGGQP